MRCLLLASAAVLGLMVQPVLAQQTEPVQPAPVPQPPAAAPPAPVTTPPPAETPTGTAVDAPAPQPVLEQAENQIRIESLVGVDVSNGQDTIGEVSDIIVTQDGRVEAVVVGVGGLLGLGQKRVALAWDSLKLTERDGTHVFLVSATRDQLARMPALKTLEEKRAEQGAQPQGGAPGVGLTTAPGVAQQGGAAGAGATTAPEAAPQGGALAPGLTTAPGVAQQGGAPGAGMPPTPTPQPGNP